jgi:hypothetical protein
MSQEEAGYFIVGITDNGNKFRPSDWAQRIASVCGCFDERHRLHYNPMLKPIKYDGFHGLFVANRLATLNPDAYNYAMLLSC